MDLSAKHHPARPLYTEDDANACLSLFHAVDFGEERRIGGDMSVKMHPAGHIAGAFVILWAERRQATPRVQGVDDMTVLDALKVGLAQCFALIPGTSRSGVTIIGGMLFGLSRQAATEFSFFLAVPTLVAAGAYDGRKHRALFEASDAGWFAVGFAASFVSAFLCVRWLLRFVASHDFRIFAWYRIAFGVLVLVTAFAGVIDWSAG